MDGDIRRTGKNVYRIENVNIMELANLLNHVFQYSDFADFVINPETNEIFVESPNTVDSNREQEMVERYKPIIPLDEVKIDNMMLHELVVRVIRRH